MQISRGSSALPSVVPLIGVSKKQLDVICLKEKVVLQVFSLHNVILFRQPLLVYTF